MYVYEINLAYDIHELVKLERENAVLKMKKFKLAQILEKKKKLPDGESIDKIENEIKEK
jgi:hypothetical protein